MYFNRHYAQFNTFSECHILGFGSSKKCLIQATLICTLICIGSSSCLNETMSVVPMVDDSVPYTPTTFSAPHHEAGILVYNGDMAKYRWTEMNSQYVVRTSPDVKVAETFERYGYNTFAKISFSQFDSPTDFVEMQVATFGRLDDEQLVPTDLATMLRGFRFRAVAPTVPLVVAVTARNIKEDILARQVFDIRQDSMMKFELRFVAEELKSISFTIEKNLQVNADTTEGSIIIDDLYLIDEQQVFTPPQGDQAFLTWLKQGALRYFLSQYREITPGQGCILETSHDETKVSISGMGFGFAANILAEQAGLLSSATSRSRIIAMLAWLQNQTWEDGKEGWHGFPFHYYYPDGRAKWPSVSTIDAAICAAGIRVVRQRYREDQAVTAMTDELIGRTRWEEAIGDGRIAMGFDGSSGELNPWRWGLSFSEETELVYLEALSSGRVQSDILQNIVRRKKNGFFCSWFGAGFVYNWLQLWTGPIEPYRSNSRLAYQADLEACQQNFGRPLIGLTACQTISSLYQSGFAKWKRYISNQGSYTHGTSNAAEVIRLSPAPYGAALALPFMQTEAIGALRAYVELGFYHAYWGLPNNIRLSNLPLGMTSPAPNWNQRDIDAGPMAMAIEQIQDNLISQLYMGDERVRSSLEKIIEAFPE